MACLGLGRGLSGHILGVMPPALRIGGVKFDKDGYRFQNKGGRPEESPYTFSMKKAFQFPEVFPQKAFREMPAKTRKNIKFSFLLTSLKRILASDWDRA